MYKVAAKDAVGLMIAHDITKVVPGEKQSAIFHRGDIIKEEDIPILLALGKEEILVGIPTAGEVHEEEAALRIATGACGNGLSWTQPSQGRVNITAEMPGLLKVDVTRLNQVNNQEGFVLATLHNNRVVKKDQVIAGTRIVPLSIGKNELQRVEEICAHSTPLLSIKPFIKQKAGIVTTGNEIFQRRVQDRFYPTLEQKLRPFGASILSQTFCPDDPKLIAEQILTMQDKGAELILVTGGMSVDCNDLTPKGIELSGASIIKYGPPILPASQFILAYLGDIPICGIPGGALFSRITTFDLLLPRLLAGDQIERSEIVAMGHGGLCMDCPECFFPDCAFGKSNS